MEEAVKDRRLFHRLERDFRGSYLAKDANERRDVRCVNVSGTGAMLCSESKLPDGEPLELELVSDRVKNPLAVNAKLVWQRPVLGGKWHAGVSFHEPTLLSLWPLIEKSSEEF